MKNDDYYDWLMLINEAKQAGLTDEEIISFFKENFKIRLVQKEK
jgi:hypothetical protein